MLHGFLNGLRVPPPTRVNLAAALLLIGGACGGLLVHSCLQRDLRAARTQPVILARQESHENRNEQHAERIASAGLCLGMRRDEVLKRRAAYTSRFLRWESHVYYDRDAGVQVLGPLAEPMRDAALIVQGFFREQMALPDVYVYRSREVMEQLSCIGPDEVVFYDGAVHVAPIDSHNQALQTLMRERLAHALTHHVLLQRGIRGPAWVHEGLAMFVAGEVWWHKESWGLRDWGRHNHLPFEMMDDVSAHTAAPKIAVSALYQSLTMMQAVNHARGEPGVRGLVDALAAGEIAPADAWRWAVGEQPEERERAWRNAVANQQIMGGFFRDWRPPPELYATEHLDWP